MDENRYIPIKSDIKLTKQQIEDIRYYASDAPILNTIDRASKELLNFKNPVVSELEKLNERNKELYNINEQYLKMLEKSNQQNDELNDIIKTLKADIDKERGEKAKADKRAMFFTILSIVLAIVAIVVPLFL